MASRACAGVVTTSIHALFCAANPFIMMVCILQASKSAWHSERYRGSSTDTARQIRFRMIRCRSWLLRAAATMIRCPPS